VLAGIPVHFSIVEKKEVSMPYPQDLVGKYINYKIHQGGAVNMSSQLVNGVLPGQTTAASMSGCYLCTYNQGGQKLAHIGTADKVSDSNKAKKAWLTFVARPDVSGVKGGSPSDYFRFGDIKNLMEAGSPIPQIVGYFAGGSAYAILLGPVRTNQNPSGLNLLKVLALKTMTMQPWSSIAAMRRFQV
jgi:hypothetical protein